MSLEMLSVLEPAEAGYAAQITAATGAGAPWEVLHGRDVEDAVASHPRSWASLLAPPTHGRSALAQVVAESVAVRSPRPVLLVRPPVLR